MPQIKKMSTLLRKIREFYTKNGNEWGTGALRTIDGKYCLLGAAACVVTNKKVIDTMTVTEAGQAMKGEYGADDIVSFGHYYEIPDVKGKDILQRFERFFEHNVRYDDGNKMSVDVWNDRHPNNRADVLAQLRRLERIALKNEGKR